MTQCDSYKYNAGDDIIIPIEYAQGDITGIVNFESFNKIEIKAYTPNGYECKFSTDSEAVDAAHLITFDTPTTFELIIPNTDTVNMLGEISIVTTYYFDYKTVERRVTGEIINTGGVVG